MCLLWNSPWSSILSPLWGRCRARPCSWSMGALEAPAGPAAGHWPSRPLCSCPAQVYPAPPCLAFSLLPCLPVVPGSRHPSPEWACGCRWTPLWLIVPHAASLKQVVIYSGWYYSYGETGKRCNKRATSEINIIISTWIEYSNMRPEGKINGKCIKLKNKKVLRLLILQRYKNNPLLFHLLKPREAPSFSLSLLLFTYFSFHTHLLLCWVSCRTSKYCSTKVSFNHWDQTTTLETTCFCLQPLLPLALSLPHTCTLFLPHCPPFFSYSPFTLCFWKVFFLRPSKRGAKTHGSCAASLRCAKRKSACAWQQGEDEGARAGDRVTRANPLFSPSSLLSHNTKPRIDSLTKLRELCTWQHTTYVFRNSTSEQEIKRPQTHKFHQVQCQTAAFCLCTIPLHTSPHTFSWCATCSSQPSKLRCPAVL